MKEIEFTAIDGIKVGHMQDEEAATGCSVIICENGATSGVDVRGGSPATRETDLLNPVNMVQQIHAIVLSGGSAYGLDSCSGVMKYLEEKDIGFDVQVAKVPIVCGACLFDLVIGSPKVRPDLEMGYKAAQNANNTSYPNGNIGAGCGATVGKYLGPEFSMKGGLGTYAIQVGDLQVGAIVAVNCLGDVIDPEDNNKILAGMIKENKFMDTEKIMISNYHDRTNLFSGNTTIGAIVTNAKFDKSEITKIASMTHNGYGRTMRPAHSIYDGDTIFAMSTGDVEADLSVVGMLAANVMEKAVVQAIKNADTLHGVKAYKDLK
ncbi:MAG: P1 family peptidase [Terrisporobacter sp.]|uniref:P1 family peptidase n=1 Tax=Terrisporobacter sp. TaxID=1965305 RepID=UPI002FCA7717